MNDKLKGIWNRIVEYWKGLSAKQRALIISGVAVVVVTLVILYVVLSKPQMQQLCVCESTKQASEVVSLLEGEGISYETSEDGLNIKVKKEDISTATLLLGANEIQSTIFTIDNVSSGMTSTEADKQRRYILYLEDKIASVLESMEPIKEASVNLDKEEDDGTLIAKDKDASVWVNLTLVEPIDAEIAANIARSVATAVGNKTTENITVSDSQGNMLFNGTDDTSAVGSATSQLTAKSKAEAAVAEQVQKVMLSNQVYDNAEVSANLVLDFDQSKTTDHQYYAPDGQSQGMLTEEHQYESEATNGVAGTPGTDSNDEDGYQIENDGTSSSSVSEIDKTYAPNETITETEKALGNIVYDESSLSVVATEYVFYYEERLEEQGLLADMSFDDFREQNAEKVKTEVDADYITLISKATGIAEENISVVAYQVPYFVEKEITPSTIFNNILQIVLLVLISALLIFVIIKGTRPVQTEEAEPELSIEALLKTTQENQLEEIDYDERSEVRKMIDKFVDENPEAVSSLLRSWLNEDWGD